MAHIVIISEWKEYFCLRIQQNDWFSAVDQGPSLYKLFLNKGLAVSAVERVTFTVLCDVS